MEKADKDDQQDSTDCARPAGSFLERNPLFRFFSRLSEDQYRPEKHYMRGPGPKCKVKDSE